MKEILTTIKDLTVPHLTTYINKQGDLALGYNRTLGIYNGQTCSLKCAEFWLVEDITAIRRAIDLSIGTILHKHQERGLVSLVHDIGIETFNSSKLRQYLLNKQFTLAANCFLMYNTNIRTVSIGVIRRRQIEQNIFNLPCGK